MPRDPQARRDAERLQQLARELSAALDAMAARQTTIRAALADGGVAPGQPPDGFRYVTLDEMRTEFNDVATTAARRQQLMAIRCGLRPPETVALPPTIKVGP